MKQNIHFNAQCSPIGAFASFTLGAKGAKACVRQSRAVTVENFWTGERETLDGEFITKRLESRSAILWDIQS